MVIIILANSKTSQDMEKEPTLISMEKREQEFGRTMCSTKNDFFTFVI